MAKPRGRPPKPTALHELHGDPGKGRLKARRAAEPKPTKSKGMEPPPVLSREAKKEWRRLTVEFERLGMMTVVDRGALAAYCAEWARFLDAERAIAEEGAVVTDAAGVRRRNPWVMIQQASIQAMLPLWSRFGMTPGDRPRLGKPPGAGGGTRDPEVPGAPAPPPDSFEALLAAGPDATEH